MQKTDIIKKIYLKLISIFIGLVAIFVFIIPALSISTLSKDSLLQEIIRKAEIRQQSILDNIQDATFMGKATYKELDKDGSVKKDVFIQRRIYMKQYGKRCEEYISMVVDGKTLSKEEIEKERKEWQKKSKSEETKMPLSKEAKEDYEYKLLGSDIFNGMPVWVVQFTSKKKEDGYINGTGYILKDKYDIVYAKFVPAKIPSVIKDMNMSLSYSEVQGYWLPSKFEMYMKINVKFLFNVYYKQIKIDDTYSQYKLNSGLQDSLFEAKG